MTTQADTTAPDKAEAGSRYRYDRFTTKLLLNDLRFSSTAPSAGSPMPDFDLETLDGGRVRRDDLVGERPVLLVLGSLTCPMTASSAPSLEQLHREYGDRVEFVTVYTREAHPGEQIPQPSSLDEKRAHAASLAERDHLGWRVAIDDLEGTLHRQLDGKPNAAYLMDRDGRLAFRTIWASDTGSLRAALDAVSQGRRPKRQSSSAMARPMMAALGSIDPVVAKAGSSAQRDMWRANAPMALMGKAANLFGPLSAGARGPALMALMSAIAVAAAVGIGWLVI